MEASVQQEVADVRPAVNSVRQFGIAHNQNARWRRTMEDECVALDPFGGIDKTSYFAVYDGHGGRGAVEFVTEALHTTFLEIYPQAPSIADAWKAAYERTDQLLIQNPNTVLLSGSTAVTAFIREHQGQRWLHVANVGDSRAVLVRDGQAHRLTVDHKPSDEEEIRRIQAADGYIMSGRVEGILAVTRSFGDVPLKKTVIAEPHTADVLLGPLDTHLILACDGLWDVCSDETAASLVCSETDADAMSKKLVAHALKERSTDNVTVIVVAL